MPKRDKSSPRLKKDGTPWGKPPPRTPSHLPPPPKPGEQRALKYTTPEARAEIVELYRQHLASGMSGYTFLECDSRTVEKVIKDHPDEFPPGTLDYFNKLNVHFWEKMGTLGTAGKLPGFNAQSWAVNMRHRFKWLPKDPEDPLASDKPTVIVLNLGKELKPPQTIEHKPQPKQPEQLEQQKVISPYDAE